MLPKSTFRTPKGQSALEFIMMMAMILIVATVFLFSVLSLLRDAAEQERLAAINDLGYMIQDELILAILVEDGYTRSFVVPQLADRFVYTISSTATGVTLSSGALTITYTIPEITGTIEKGTNIITKTGTVTVSQ